MAALLLEAFGRVSLQLSASGGWLCPWAGTASPHFRLCGHIQSSERTRLIKEPALALNQKFEIRSEYDLLFVFPENFKEISNVFNLKIFIEHRLFSQH